MIGFVFQPMLVWLIDTVIYQHVPQLIHLQGKDRVGQVHIGTVCSLLTSLDPRLLLLQKEKVGVVGVLQLGFTLGYKTNPPSLEHSWPTCRGRGRTVGCRT